MKEKIKRNAKTLFLSSKNIIFRSLNKPLKPMWLWFEVTNLCNSRCVHCNIWREKPRNDYLSPEEIEKILANPLFSDVTYIINSGGEPTVRPDLKEIFLAEHKALPNAILQLSTNGLLPKKVIELVEFSLENNIKIDIGVSLDGIGKDHDKVRGIKGNFRKVDYLLRKLAILKNEGANIGISVGTVLSDFTLPNIQRIREYVRKVINQEVNVQWYNESSFYKNIGNKIVNYDERVYKCLKSLVPNPEHDLWLKWLKGKSIRFPCFAMQTFFVLRCNGDIVPCLSLWDLKAGNIRDEEPLKVWNSKKAEEVRKIVKRCEGCLNTWGVCWSYFSSGYKIINFYLRHPYKLTKELLFR